MYVGLSLYNLILTRPKYDKSLNSPNSALVIFREKQSFDNLNNLKTFNFKVRRRPFKASDYVNVQTNPSSKTGNDKLDTKSLPSSPKTAPRSEGELVEFKVKVEPWRGNHRSYIERTPYWGPFKIIPSMIQQHLEKMVPLPGLSDVSVDRPPPPLKDLERRSRKLADAAIKKALIKKPLSPGTSLKAIRRLDTLSEVRKQILKLKTFLKAR
jgi:hypothetical protein